VHCGCDYIATDSDNYVQKRAAKIETVSFEGKKWGWGSFEILVMIGALEGGREGGSVGDVNLVKL